MTRPLTSKNSDAKPFGASNDFLADLKGEPKHFENATYDIETSTDLQKVYLLGFYDGVQYKYFESAPMLPETPGSAVDQFMRWLLERPGFCRYRIYAHNGGNFDHLYLTAWALAHPEDVSLEIIPIQSSVLSLSIIDTQSHGGRTAKWQFIDSMKLMPGSLESVAKAFGFDGGKVKATGPMRFEHEGVMYDGAVKEGDEWRLNYETLHLNPIRYEYLQTDCELLWKCIDRFSTLLIADGGEVGITTPSTAMKVYRRRFMRGPIETNRCFPGCPDPDCRGCLHDFIRRGYYGGRTEVYRDAFDGPGLLSVGDFNSMYPAVMQEQLPCFLVGVENGVADRKKYPAPYRVGFVECTVSIPKHCYIPPLAYRYDGKLVFPTGTFSGVWTTPELARLENVGGRILKEKQSVWFGTKFLFDEFVATWYAFRNKDAPNYSKAMDTIAKLMLNSLYGKFGQGETREKIWIFPTDEELSRGALTQLPNARDGVMKEDVFSETRYVIPHIAAYITALARCRLWDSMQSILTRGKQVYYADTDSIFTNSEVPNSKVLGELKLEYKVEKGIFVAPKLYALRREFRADPGGCGKCRSGDTAGTSHAHEVIKAKGFSAGFGAERIDFAKFLELVAGRTSQTVKRITKLREGLRKDTEQFPRMKEVVKSIKGKDTKRIHLGDGNTRPIHMRNGVPE